MIDWKTAACVATPIVLCAWGVHATALHRELGTWKTDPVTGLPVRRAFYRRARRALHRHSNMVVALIDFDRFKPINDQHGHPAGDEVLAALGTRLADFFGPRAVVGRLGGDEFAVVAPLGDRNGPWRDHLNDLAAELAAPVRLTTGPHAGRLVDVGASIGAVHLPHGHRAVLSGVLNLADRLMYDAKRRHLGLRVHLADRHEPAVTTPTPRNPASRWRDLARAVGLGDQANGDRPEVVA